MSSEESLFGPNPFPLNQQGHRNWEDARSRLDEVWSMWQSHWLAQPPPIDAKELVDYACEVECTRLDIYAVIPAMALTQKSLTIVSYLENLDGLISVQIKRVSEMRYPSFLDKSELLIVLERKLKSRRAHHKAEVLKKHREQSMDPIGLHSPAPASSDYRAPEVSIAPKVTDDDLTLARQELIDLGVDPDEVLHSPEALVRDARLKRIDSRFSHQREAFAQFGQFNIEAEKTAKAEAEKQAATPKGRKAAKCA